MNPVFNNRVGVIHRNGKSNAIEYRDIDPVIAGVTGLSFIHTRIRKQFVESVQFVIAPLVDMIDTELGRPALHYFLLPAADEGQDCALALKRSHAQPVAGAESLHFVSLLVEIQTPIG